MPNSYTAVPNVIPGQLSVGGDLDVKGELRVGPFTGRARIAMINNATAAFGFNLQKDEATRDDVSKGAQLFLLDGLAPERQYFRVNVAGIGSQEAVMSQIFSDYTLHTNTGNTTENTIYSKIIRAGLLSSNGALRLTIAYTATVQGAVAATLRVKSGGFTLAGISIPAADNAGESIVDVLIAEQNSANAQTTTARKSVSGIAPTINRTGTAVNVAADATFIVTIQSGANTDQQDFRMCSMELLNTYGPVT